MRKFASSILCLAVLTTVACRSDERAVKTAVREVLTDYQGRDRPGACLLVRHQGAPIFEQCYGMANLEEGRLAGPQTNFRLASVTKQFTAMAIVQLVDAGKLTLDKRLTDVLPGFPDYGADITLRHLLTHTSGLISYESLLPEDQTEQVKDADVLRMMMEQDSTYFVPGSAYRYSNSGYAVLAMVIERVSGMRFAEFLATNIFEPLGMAHTVAHEDGVDTVYKRAYGYSRSDGGWERDDQSTTSAVLGDGGIYTSLEDLANWYAVIERRRPLVSTESLDHVFQPMVLNDGEVLEYGLGWNVDEYQGRKRYYHGGSTRGFRNNVQHFPDEDLTVVFLSNRNEIEEGLADSIVNIFLR